MDSGHSRKNSLGYRASNKNPLVFEKRFKMKLLISTTVLLGFLSLFGGEVRAEDVDPKAPIVELKGQGKLQGISLTSRKGREYFGFLSVPFGKIPERFAVPEPSDSWDGVKNAQTLPPMCIHFNVFVQQVVGVEDCLMLNVYSPKLDAKAKLPVIVFNTPGGFQIGGARMYEGKYIMDEDVVFVSINNRLGALGFLNTGDGVVSGNMGLKDQVMALKWVKANIHKFGGDPDLVTISGISAGGAGAHYHMLSPMSKGLIHRSISQSGTALNPWAFQPNPVKILKRFADNVDCVRDSSEELVKCLRAKEPSEIITAQLKLSKFGPEYDMLSMNFLPSVESPDAKGPRFLSKTPYEIIKNGEMANKVPWIAGLTENEGSFFDSLMMAQQKSIDTLNQDWSKIMPNILFYEESSPPKKLDAISRKIRDFYFGGKDLTLTNKQNLSDIFTDRFFANGIVKSIKLQAAQHPTYSYVLGFMGKYSGLTTLFGAAIKEMDGVSHADDLVYMFNQTFGFPEIELGTKEGDFSVKYLKLWASFAKDGKPTATWGPQKEWNPVDPKKDKRNLKFYELDAETSLIEDPYVDRRELWEGLPLKEDDKFEIPADVKEEL